MQWVGRVGYFAAVVGRSVLAATVSANAYGYSTLHLRSFRVTWCHTVAAQRGIIGTVRRQKAYKEKGSRKDERFMIVPVYSRVDRSIGLIISFVSFV